MFTGNQTAILRILAGEPGGKFSMSDLGRVLGKPPGVFQRGLNTLEDTGYIVSRRQGNRRLFSYNTAHPLHEEVRRIIRGAAATPLPRDVCETFPTDARRSALQIVEPPGVYTTSSQKILIIAGPNGAGKTTFAREFLPQEAHCFTFINADFIAHALSPFSPETAAFKAGKLMLKETDERIKKRQSLALETTLSGRRYAQLIPAWQDLGYVVKLIFLSLPHVEMAISRVAARIQQGGHPIPKPVIRRRFDAGLANFETQYKPLVDAWALYDSSGMRPRLIEEDER